jgi:biofilm protein TabA
MARYGDNRKVILMILDTIYNIEQYSKLHPLFPQVFEYICNTNLHKLASGRHTVLGDDVFVLIQHGAGQTKAKAKLECHRKYIDIQLVLGGVDEMGWKPLADCQQAIDSFNTVNDVQFFEDSPLNWLTIPTNKFCIFFPEDAHSGMVSEHHIHKAVFKIAVNPT